MASRLETTIRDGLAKVVATTLTSNPLARKLLSEPEVWKGNLHKQPVKVLANNNFVTFNGMDVLPTSQTDTTRNMQFVDKVAAINVALSLQEVNVNFTDTSVTDLVKYKMQEAALDMAEGVGNVFYGNGVGKDFNGMGNIVDDGTVAATIGGLSRAAFPTLRATVTAVGAGILTLNAMTTLFNTISDSGIQPNLIVCNKTVNALYEKIAQVLNQYLSLPAGAGKYNAGAVELSFKGRPVMIDAKATAQTMFFLNTDYLKWVMVKPKTGKPVEFYPEAFAKEGGVPDPDTKGLGFSWTEFMNSFNQYAMNGYIILQGELVPTSPNRLGKLTGITTA